MRPLLISSGFILQGGAFFLALSARDGLYSYRFDKPCFLLIYAFGDTAEEMQSNHTGSAFYETERMIGPLLHSDYSSLLYYHDDHASGPRHPQDWTWSPRRN